MVKLFYSGATTLNAEQFTPSKSLGGYISSTPIPNGQVNTVFSDFSYISLEEGKTETKAFFIKNIGDKTIKDLLVFCLTPEVPKADILVASQKGTKLELLRSPNDIPYYLTFYTLNVVYASVNIKIENDFQIGETATIEGVDIPVTSQSRMEFMNKVVLAFKNNQMYDVSIVDDVTFKMTYKILGDYTNTPQISSYNANTFSYGSFSGGVDNSRLLATELAPGECIGIFLQRKINSETVLDYSDEYYETLYSEFEKNNYQTLNKDSSEKVRFCLSWGY